MNRRGGEVIDIWESRGGGERRKWVRSDLEGFVYTFVFVILRSFFVVFGIKIKSFLRFCGVGFLFVFRGSFVWVFLRRE